MQPGRLLRSLVMRLLAARGLRHAGHLLGRGRRALSQGPAEVLYFHQVDDPYAHLAVQTLAALTDLYDVRLVPHLAAPPDASNAPEAELLAAWSRRDAADIAPSLGLQFTDPGAQPDTAHVDQARAILAGTLTSDDFAQIAVAVGQALWAGDQTALDALADRHRPLDAAVARSVEDTGTALRRQRGHYAGAMLYLDGEWYWGVDRLAHLETRLSALGLQRAPAAFIAPRPTLQYPTHAPASVQLQVYFSLRSPYSAIVLRRAIDYAERAGVALQLKPVLPMVMRGVALTPTKGRYIMLDTAREAERASMPFGWLVDPIGEPVEQGFALLNYAREMDCEYSYLLSYIEGVWCHGIDASTDRGLARIVERAGLSWEQAREHRLDDRWRDEVEHNRLELYDLGLWGVPSFRVTGPEAEPDWSAWGQDRLWRASEEITRRAAL